MKSTFPLFNSHLDLAHFWWSKVVTESDTVIDMTCGNGHDTLFLSSLHPKKLIALDIQPEALASAKKKVPDAEYHLVDHALFPCTLEENSIKLAVYNLGWLPGSDKSCTTYADTTLKSLFELMPKITSGGVISITCYPGHPEGKKEENVLLETLPTLNPLAWSACFHSFPNRKASPSLILLQKTLS